MRLPITIIIIPSLALIACNALKPNESGSGSSVTCPRQAATVELAANSGQQQKPDLPEFPPSAWKPIAISLLSPRIGHSAVWTGDKMIVWGGCESSSPSQYVDFLKFCDRSMNDGAIYDPKTDIWKPLSTKNAPSGRTGHLAVWNGKQMLIWGGFQRICDRQHPACMQFTNSGGIYDPASDTWRPMSKINAPEDWSNSQAFAINGNLVITEYKSRAQLDIDIFTYDLASDAWTHGQIRHSDYEVIGYPVRPYDLRLLNSSQALIWSGGSLTEDVKIPGQTDFKPKSRIFDLSKLVSKDFTGDLANADFWPKPLPDFISGEATADSIISDTSFVAFGSFSYGKDRFDSRMVKEPASITYNFASHKWNVLAAPTCQLLAAPTVDLSSTVVDPVTSNSMTEAAVRARAGFRQPLRSVWIDTTTGALWNDAQHQYVIWNKIKNSCNNADENRVPLLDGYTTVWTGKKFIVWGGRYERKKVSNGIPDNGYEPGSSNANDPDVDADMVNPPPSDRSPSHDLPPFGQWSSHTNEADVTNRPCSDEKHNVGGAPLRFNDSANENYKTTNAGFVLEP